MKTLWVCEGELEGCTEEHPCEDCCGERYGHVRDDDHECTACGVSFAELYADSYDEGDR